MFQTVHQKPTTFPFRLLKYINLIISYLCENNASQRLCRGSIICNSNSNNVTFRPRSTSVADTVTKAEGFACCCRVANDEDGYRVGTGHGFKLTAVDVGHLILSAT